MLGVCELPLPHVRAEQSACADRLPIRDAAGTARRVQNPSALKLPCGGRNDVGVCLRRLASGRISSSPPIRHKLVYGVMLGGSFQNFHVSVAKTMLLAIQDDRCLRGWANCWRLIPDGA